MKLDNIKKENSTPAKQTNNTPKRNESGNNIIDMINPLMSVNINSDLHSFYNYREAEKNVLELLRAQSNLVFYAIHQSFMIDEEHKEFFKNMIGRFYDVPKNLWGYYAGKEHLIRYSPKREDTIGGLILLENNNLYKRLSNGNLDFFDYKFYLIAKETHTTLEKYSFNANALIEYSGVKIISNNFCETKYYGCVRRLKQGDVKDSRTDFYISPDLMYEYGRFDSNHYKIYKNFSNKEENLWFKATWEWLENNTEDNKSVIQNKAIYASLGLENKDKIVSIIRKKAGDDFEESWIPEFSEDDEKMIRSLSQTFEWSKKYIMENEELLNLDVLALNMTVPWDFELVKFFIRRGYGSRMTENKAVFDKVFEPLLTDSIVEKLFRCEYEKYPVAE